MMISPSVLRPKLDTLINLLLTAGVQPGELADNIFLESYKRISYERRKQDIVGELEYIEYTDCKKIDITIRYYYGFDKRINRIEEESEGTLLILWDRGIAEYELVNDIVDIMKSCYTDKEIKSFMLSFPEELRAKIVSVIENVA